MGFLKYLNQFVAIFVDTIKMMSSGRIWLLLTGYMLLNFVLLYAHYDFLSPMFYWAISPWTEFVSASSATAFTHYPGHFLLLPYFFGLAKVGLGLLLEGLILGMVAVGFHNAFLGATGNDRLRIRSVAASWFYLVVVWFVINGLTTAIATFFPDWLEFFHGDSPRRLLAVEFVIIPFTQTLALALFLFAIPIIAVDRENLFRGLGRALGIFLRRPLTCLSLAAVILSGPFVMSILAGRSGDIINRFRLKPEIVFWILAVGLVIELLANFFWMGTTVRFLMEDESE